MSELQAAGHGMEKLSVAKREALIIENCNVHIEPATLANMELDPISDIVAPVLLPRCQRHCCQGNRGTGDYLFNSSSTLFIGTEALTVELRHKTCLEICLNQDIRKHKDASSF